MPDISDDERRAETTAAAIDPIAVAARMGFARYTSGGRFRSADYSYHCELGGHPVPGSWRLLNDDAATAQLMLSDCLSHSTRIWGHVFEWAKAYMLGEIVSDKHEAMGQRFAEWQRLNRLTTLPPPPVKGVMHV